MTTLFDFYKQLKGFVEGHRMINKFKVVGSIEEVDTMNVDARSLFISVESSNISHRLNTNKVTFALFVVDKCLADDQESLVISMQENLFVVGQIQDFILSLDNDVEFEEVSIAQAPNDDYNLTAAVCSFEVDFDKNISCTDESLNSTFQPEIPEVPVTEYGFSPVEISEIFQSTTFGNFAATINYDSYPGGMPVADQGKILKLELIDYAGRKKVLRYTSAIQVAVGEDIRSTFPENVELRVRIWLEDANNPGKRYIKDPVNIEYEEVMFLYGRYMAMVATSSFEIPLGLNFNSTTSVQSQYTLPVMAYARISDVSKHILYEAELMRADSWAGPFTSVYSKSGYIDGLQSNQQDPNVKDLFLMSPQTTPGAYGCSNHTTDLVGRFYILYREQAVDFDGNLTWGAHSVNHNYYTITDSSNALPSC